MNNYEIFIQRRKHLAKLLSDSAQIERDLNMLTACSTLEKMASKVNDDTFKILVMGTFKNGKSTLINSLLGEPVLPAYALPATAVINEVKYGETKSAMLHFKPEPPTVMSKYVPDDALAHMKKYGMQNVPPMAIGFDEIRKYVTIPLGVEQKQAALESPFEKVEVFYPLEILKNGVEIIDSPGLNENITRTDVTMGYLHEVDAVLFVLNATALCSEMEMECIDDEVVGNGFENPFFVVNRFDIIKEEERKAMKDYAVSMLSEYSKRPIFYVSAQDALDAKLNGDDMKLGESGISGLEECLSNFLTKEKGIAKLTQPAKEIKKILNGEALCSVIPQQRKMLDTSLDKLKLRYEKAKPQLDDLKIEREQLSSKFKLSIEQSKYDIERVAVQYFKALVDKIPAWIEGFVPETKYAMVPTKKRAKAIVCEIVDFLTKKIKEDQKEWAEKTFKNVVDSKHREIFDNRRVDLEKMMNKIEEISICITGQENFEPNRVSAMERILAAGAGLVLHDVTIITSGGINGFSKEMLYSILAEIASVTVLMIIGCLNPFTLAAVVIGAAFGNIVSAKNKAMKKTKDLVINQSVKVLANDAEKNSKKIRDNVVNHFNEEARVYIAGLDSKVDDVMNQVNQIIREMEKGQMGVDKRKAELDKCEEKIHEVNSHLDSLIMELVN